MKLITVLTRKHRENVLNYLIENGPQTVTKIYTTLSLTQSYCSQILKDLTTCKLIQPSRDGKYIYYNVIDGNLLLFKNLQQKLKDEEQYYYETSV